MKHCKFKNIVNLDSIGSTNSYLKKNLDKYPDGTVIFARDQNEGRGKFDRKWYGKPDHSIFCSFLSKNIDNPFDAIRFNFKFSLIVSRTLQLYTSQDKLVLKWPNDLLVKPAKKICGILSEYSENCVITGIGINLKSFAIPETIAYQIAFLQDISTGELNIEQFQIKLVEQANLLFDETFTLPAEQIPDLWFKEAAIAGKKVTIDNGNTIITGQISGITDYGALIINTDNGLTEIINTGDIVYHD